MKIMFMNSLLTALLDVLRGIRFFRRIFFSQDFDYDIDLMKFKTINIPNQYRQRCVGLATYNINPLGC